MADRLNGRRPRRRVMSNMNVVPYIDVMLVLLVIFMVAAPMINPGVVALPSVGADTKPVTAPIEVTLTKDETLTVQNRANGTPEMAMTLDQLGEYILQQQIENPDQAVVIAADKDIRYEAVLQVMDALQQKQIKRVGLLVQPAPSR